MDGQPLHAPGRPRDEDVARRARRLEERLAKATAEIAAFKATQAQHLDQHVEACLRQVVVMTFLGASTGGAAECARHGFPEQAPSKSQVAKLILHASKAAQPLFKQYFEGKGHGAACDEIYLSGHPVLDVVEPRSLAITGLAPNTQPTQVAWAELLNCFNELEAGVSDQGTGVSCTLAAKLQRVALDIWHLLRAFCAAVGRLEAQAYEWIAEVDRRKNAFLAALPWALPPLERKLPCRQPLVPPQLTRLEEAQERCEKTIAFYDRAQTVLGFLYEAAEFVDAQGRVRQPQQIQADWEAALDLVQYIEVESLLKLADKLRGKVSGAHARELAARLQAVPLPKGWQEVERVTLQPLACQAWRYHHARQTHLCKAPRLAAAWLAAELQLPFVAPHLEAYCAAVFEILDGVLRASSAVECINSVIRLRQGAKRHPHVDFVYLLAWLHNTRPFSEGRRKGLTPAELLGVKLPGDGLAMLFKRMAEDKAVQN
jgi:hypothetical protein